MRLFYVIMAMAISLTGCSVSRSFTVKVEGKNLKYPLGITSVRGDVVKVELIKDSVYKTFRFKNEEAATEE